MTRCTIHIIIIIIIIIIQERGAKKSNPKCQVEVKYRSDDFKPTVFVQYGKKETGIMKSTMTMMRESS